MAEWAITQFRPQHSAKQLRPKHAQRNLLSPLPARRNVVWKPVREVIPSRRWVAILSLNYFSKCHGGMSHHTIPPTTFRQATQVHRCSVGSNPQLDGMLCERPCLMSFRRARGMSHHTIPPTTFRQTTKVNGYSVDSTLRCSAKSSSRWFRWFKDFAEVSVLNWVSISKSSNWFRQNAQVIKSINR